ncbi:amino acid ABC transporter permease [Pusillimonas noertemannii]|uniref:Glutamate/aspartate import permease protein GltK n=1 Tax=Pusillimonas noertemannii TaxID=305977 RepID=A0A2U1CQ23_9BURK|nr:amino acid ABC transporter permease [Pusillimonas noertemannii]NYT67313.1 amino acid ABC transporter permease [Pusillimonas noertemannii]PVY67987.1 glutamate/aspartate transport system permease protein [Pusillimonas noertemannii]TFL12500.1 amino acid ABC transporter permease [Pusillimonas noertemannii]
MNGFDFDTIVRTAPYLFKVGLVFTLKLTFLSTVGAIVLGTLLAMMRLSSNRLLSGVAGTYVNLMRALPLILIIFWFYFLVPYIVGWVTQAGRPIAVGGFTSALITFVLFEAAYFCEIMRAGIQSIPSGQAGAGYALGLNYWQVMGKIVLPQAFRNMTPLLLTQMIVVFQDTSLVYVLSLTDFLGAANNVAQRDGRLVEMFVFVAVVYFIISYTASRLVKVVEQRMAIAR